MTQRFGGLGKGLDALLPIGEEKLPQQSSTDGTRVLPLEKISRNPNQPRKTFDPLALEQLAETIKRDGVLQPVIVEKNGPDTYIIVAGERRVRAAHIAGLSEIPAIIKKFSREESFLVSILENLQRQDLNPIEEASAFRQLMDLTGLNQDGVAAKVGKNRATIANSLRLLKLPQEIQEAVKTETISAGHARTLLSVENSKLQMDLFQQILDEKLSVREIEKRVSELTHDKEDHSAAEADTVPMTQVKRAVPAPCDAELVAFEERFIKMLGTKVKIVGDFSCGSIKIEYYSGDDLERLYQIFSGNTNNSGAHSNEA